MLERMQMIHNLNGLGKVVSAHFLRREGSIDEGRAVTARLTLGRNLEAIRGAVQ